jgi:hypothetical protein
MWFYVPQIQLDFWLGVTVLAVSTAFTAKHVHSTFWEPLALLAELGYGTANKDASWPALVTYLRLVGAFSAVTAAVALYYWYAVSMAYGIWFWIVMDLPFLSVMCYRAFMEDPSNGLCGAKSQENAKKGVKYFGGKTGLLLFAAVVLYCEFYNGTNYVVDSKHGLPSELTMMLGVVKNRFLKGHH